MWHRWQHFCVLVALFCMWYDHTVQCICIHVDEISSEHRSEVNKWVVVGGESARFVYLHTPQNFLMCNISVRVLIAVDTHQRGSAAADFFHCTYRLSVCVCAPCILKWDKQFIERFIRREAISILTDVLL